MSYQDGPTLVLPPITPAIKVILIANIALQLLHLAVPALGDWLSMSPIYFLEQPWRVPLNLFSSMWLHSVGSLGHLFGNMLMLYFLGHIVEEHIGTRRFFRLYLICGVVGALVFCALSPLIGAERAQLLGASGAVYGIITYAACLVPHQTIILLFIPVKLWWLVAGLAIFALYDTIAPIRLGYGGGGVAHSAHLGGMACAYALWRFRDVLFQWQVGRERRRSEKERDSARANDAELDRILAKIHEVGMNGLTGKERRFLQDHSKK